MRLTPVDLFHVRNLPGDLTNNHAEQFLCHHLNGNVDIIGTSGVSCPTCKGFFDAERDIQIVWNENSCICKAKGKLKDNCMNDEIKEAIKTYAQDLTISMRDVPN